mmetsp:Transcript_40603/g.73227  ORF Transcript_40603/g.73227 Transcript_40603/m.73227 type:complete len:197 (-) Transcript_40603:259-849(-)
MRMTSWLRSILILAVLLSTLTISSSTEVAEDVTSHFLLGRKVQVISGTVTEHATAIGEGDVATMEIAAPNNLPTATNFGDIAMMEMTSNNMQANNPPTKSSNEYHGTRGSASARRLDIEDMLTDMTSRDPEQWSAAEWLLMILFLCFFGWLGCCMLTLCCCGGGGGGGDLLRCLCLYEICCRGGSDIDACCDYGAC